MRHRLAAIAASAITIARVAATSAPADVAAWTGEESPQRGKAWSEPSVARVTVTRDQVKSGAAALRVDLVGSGWRGVGWNWFGWYPADAATDASSCSHLVFWLKASRPDASLQVRLVDNAKGSTTMVDLRKAKVLETLPTDWHFMPRPARGARRRARPAQGVGDSLRHAFTWTALTLDRRHRFRRRSDRRVCRGQFLRGECHDRCEQAPACDQPLIYGASGVEPAGRRLWALGRALGRQPLVALQLEDPGRQRRVRLVLLERQGRPWSDFVAGNRRAGLASYLTVPMLPWVAKGPEGWGFSVAKYGPQKKVESYVADRGDGIRPDGTPITGNDPRDTSVPVDPRVSGRGHPRPAPRPEAADRSTGSTMSRCSGTRPTATSSPKGFRTTSALIAALRWRLAIKGADPSGLVAGPCTWGWTDLMYSAADAGSDRYATPRRPQGAWRQTVPGLVSRGDEGRPRTRAGKRLLDYR